jgi:hypothetical protein
MLRFYPFEDCAISKENCSVTVHKIDEDCLVLTDYHFFIALCSLNQSHLC